LSKKHSIHVVIPLTLLIMFFTNNGYAQVSEDSVIVNSQDSIPSLVEDSVTFFQDTLIINDGSIDKPIYYSAKDSVRIDIKEKKVHLYNEATVDNGEVKIEAGYIMIDLDKNEVYATYILDEDSSKTQQPQFTDGAEKIQASSIRYNFDTKKGYIEEVAIQQDENVLYMEVAKRHSNEHIHFKKGRFTTCDLEEPHYHFQLSKAVMIPEKRIVSGPMNLWVQGVPTPLGLPFIIIPQMEDKSAGLLFPQIVPVSQFGFGLQDLGYYIPISDRLQTTFYGTIYSRGSWGLRNRTEYAKRYKYRGTVDAGFQQFKTGFPTNINQNKFTLNWTHGMDSKASPYWGFSSNVQFISDNNSQNNLDPLNENYFNNSFNSDINLQRLFPGKPITSGLKISLRQNSISNNISVTAPVLTVNVTRFFPFRKIIKKTNALSRIGVTYNFEGKNSSSFGDSLLSNGQFNRIGDRFQNGLNQNITLQTTASLFKNTWKFTPIVNYSNRINFQQTEKRYDAVNNTTITDTVSATGMAHSLTFTAQLNTTVYSYYRYVGKSEAKLRHVLTPTFSFQYIPNLNSHISRTDSIGVDMAPITYSIFESSLYRVSNTNTQALINFGFNNTFELKRRSDKDTLDGFKKTRLIDALTLNGSYDLLKDSMQLSNISLNMRVSPTKWLNFVASSTFSPYDWNDSTGVTTADYAINGNQRKLGRFISTNFATTLTLTSRESRKELESSLDELETNWNADYAYFLLHPEHAINFNIPWKVSLSHVYTINRNTNQATYQSERWTQLQTLMVNGDLSFTKRWKLVSVINLDLKEYKVTNARFTLTRDMHCWALAFHWTPIGGNKSFLFSIRSTSKLFQDAKIDIKRPPAFL